MSAPDDKSYKKETPDWITPPPAKPEAAKPPKQPAATWSARQSRFDPQPITLALAVVGAALMVIAIFLPRLESQQFAQVADNTLIEMGDGWFFLGLAVGIAGTAYGAWRWRRRTYAVLVLGLVAAGLAIYDGTGDRLELSALQPDARTAFDLPRTETASAGIGIYMMGAGAALSALGGFGLSGLWAGPGRR